MMNPMVAEVNRLIGNLLAGGESVVFPEGGTLPPIRRSARRVSKKEMLPPMREVDFSSEMQGATLPERLAAAANCPLEQASEIYHRWLGHTRSETTLTIEGVGVLCGKSFQPDAAFDARLNPQGRKPVRMRRRGFDWMVAFGVVAILVAAGIALYGYQLYSGAADLTTSAVAEPAVAEPAVAVEESISVEETVTTPAAVEAPAPAPTPAPAQPTQNPSVMQMTSGRYYVVLGVYSSFENAERAVTQAAETDGTLRCGIFTFGKKWMVSPFESDDSEACNLFRRAHTDHFPDMWLYRAR
ncbi:MAG: SPOR domain-containing protein [Alistipes sp.]|nr:SPOR domain-containing protein [Alistipes sp.]